MKFIADFLGIGLPGEFSGKSVRTPGKAIYKSPGGTSIPFDYTDVDSSIATKAAVFESAGGAGTYVQPNKHTSGRFPITAIFHGDGYEAKAEAFIGALLEDGVGQLTHPAFNVPINVVPVGDIRRRDAFVSGANQVGIEVSFYETTGLQIGGETGLDQLYDAFVDAASVDFADKTKLDSPVDQASFKSKVQQVVKTVETVMKLASQGLSGATQRIEDVGDSITRGIDLLVGEPLSLARQTQILIGEPRRQANGVRAKLDGYANLANDIFSGIAAEPSKYTSDPVNGFHMDNLTASAVVANSAILASDGSDEYQTKADFFRSIEGIEALVDDYQTWYDANYASLVGTEIDGAVIDTGGGWFELRQIAAFAISDLILKSFAAKTEMRETLTADRTPLELCFELYGTTDFDTFDLFLYTNEIHGDEFFTIEQGREIVWYV